MQLAVHVTPKAGRDAVVGWVEGANGQRELSVKVRAVPEKGKATKAAGVVLAAFFAVPKSSVRCVRGQTSRHKCYEIPLDEDALSKADLL